MCSGVTMCSLVRMSCMVLSTVPCCNRLSAAFGPLLMVRWVALLSYVVML